MATTEQRGPAGRPTLADLLGSPGFWEAQGAVQGPTSGGSTAASPALPQQVVPDRPGFEVRFVEGVPYWFPAPESKLQLLNPGAHLEPSNYLRSCADKSFY